uniref:Uncharacterized protein n=1 Tax=Anguilla anguilla TaxID=7936 RepID=A0A0E9SH50_ANGAN
MQKNTSLHPNPELSSKKLLTLCTKDVRSSFYLI